MACLTSLSALGASVFLAAATAEAPLVIGTEASFPPYVIHDDSGALSGFDVDVMREICTRSGRSCSWQTTAFDALIPGVAAGQFDLVMGGMAITPDRRRLVDFSQPYAQGGAQEWFLGAPDAPAPERARIAVEAGTIHATWLRAQGLDFVSYPSETLALKAVADGSADLALGPYHERRDLTPMIEALDLHYLYTVEIPDEGIGIAVCKGNDALLVQIDAALAAMMQDGSLDRLDSLWFPH